MNNLRPDVCAIDVGFGFVKYRNGNGSPKKFQSIVTPYSRESELLAIGDSPGHIVIKSEGLNGELMAVGPGILQTQPANTGQRIMNDNFSNSSDYLALVRGALTLMNASTVSLLQLALPLTTFHSHSDALKKTMVGEHPLYKPNGEKYICFVERVEVTAQPIAAYANYVRHQHVHGLAVGDSCLIVDIGYFTIDFVVATGNLISTKRSGSTKGGMSVVVQSIMNSLSKEHNIPIDAELSHQIENALATDNLAIKNYSEVVNFTKYIAQARKVVAEHLNVVVNKVGSSRLLSDVILCGGGAKFFQPLFEMHYPHNKITYNGDSQFEVVNGMYAMGLVAAAKAEGHDKIMAAA